MASIEFRSRSSRRRAILFPCAFLLACAVSLTYVYTRPAEYRAVARLQISPASVVAESDDAKAQPSVKDDPKSFLTEVQVLTSRPLLQEVAQRLRRNGSLPDLGADPVDAIQHMLRAEPIEGTEVVQLSAVGPERDLMPNLVNTVADLYRQHVADSYKGAAANTDTEVGDEVRRLDQQVAAKRQTVDAYRARYDIVSIERNENQVLATIAGLSKTYSDANDRLVKAQAQLQAVKASIAAGQSAVRPKDDPTIANLEQRASQLREQMNELKRRFTPDYLQMDPDVKALRARLDSLDQQLKAEHRASEQAALSDAQQELSSAQAAAEGLRKDVADNQKAAQEFATRLNTYKAMQEDLDHLEAMHRAALDRLTKLETSEHERAPRVALLEMAAPSQEPWRPNYTQDALIALAGSVVFALFVTWFGDYVSGPAPVAAPEFYPSWSPVAFAREPARMSLDAAVPEVQRLAAPMPPPRELVDTEITALIDAADEDGRLALTALLMGFSLEELIALRWEQIDLVGGAIQIGGDFARVFVLEEPLHGLLAARHVQRSDSAGPVLRDARGAPLAAEDVARLVSYAALDGGLIEASEITPSVLRYTYLVFLLRQGIRAADLDRVVGRVPQSELVAYMQFASPKTRLSLDKIDRVLPALQGFAGSVS
jgi:polysaccharide biosynthesis transport protein